MTKTTYFWDEVTDNVIMESDDQGNVTTYTHEPKLQGVVTETQRSPQLLPLRRARERQAGYRHAGNVTDEMMYTAFGETVSKTGSTVNPWGYKGALGYYTNGGTDDLYVRARQLRRHLEDGYRRIRLGLREALICTPTLVTLLSTGLIRAV